MKSIISSIAGIDTHLETQFIPSTNQISVKISTTYEHSKDSEYARTLLQLCLTRGELINLVFHLESALQGDLDEGFVQNDLTP